MEFFSLPKLHMGDVRVVARQFPLAEPLRVRDHLSALISCATLGLPLLKARDIRNKWALHCGRAKMQQTGVFDRLAAASVFAPHVDWALVADGNYVKLGNPFYGNAPRDRVLAAYRPAIEEEQFERRRLLQEHSGGGGIGLKNTRVDEVRNLSKQAKRYVRAVARRGGTNGSDMLVSGMDTFYVESIESITQDVEESCLRLARIDPDPARNLDAWLVKHRVHPSEVVAVPPSWIRPGLSWRVFGLPARRRGDTLELDGLELDINALSRVPADWGTIELPKRMPRMEVLPF